MGQLAKPKKKKILIVDDHEDFLAVTGDLLEAHGYEVLRASNGAAGFTFYQKQQPRLVITDLFMGKVSGIELIKKILALKPEQKIIALSGYQDVEKRLEYLGLAMDIGATRFLQKPVEPKVLIENVRRSLRRPSGPNQAKSEVADEQD